MEPVPGGFPEAAGPEGEEVVWRGCGAVGGG